MKIKVEIDCTPGEARSFLGLPDVAPMQEAVLLDMQSRMKEAMAGADIESLFKTWMPSGMQGFDTMQKAFWDKATCKSDD